MLAMRLDVLQGYLPVRGLAGKVNRAGVEEAVNRLRVLELGAGTGLVGIAAACVWEADVTLTDLPEIVPNLKRNVEMNGELVERYGGRTATAVLDWADPGNVPEQCKRYPVAIAADPLYSPEHPKLLVDTLIRWLEWRSDSCFIVELPLRGGYDVERAELHMRLKDSGLRMVDEGEDVGVDDWRGRDGLASEVKCWWSVWMPIVEL